MCNVEVESSLHLLAKCKKEKEFWRNFETLWTDITSQNITISEKDVIFGTFEDFDDQQFLNYCLLQGKQFIFQSKEQNNLSISTFITRLKHQSQIEKIIATKNSKIENYNKKWKKFNLASVNM